MHAFSSSEIKKYLVTAPAIGKGRSLLLDADDLLHVLIGRICGHQVMIGQLILLHDALRRSKDSGNQVLTGCVCNVKD